MAAAKKGGGVMTGPRGGRYIMHGGNKHYLRPGETPQDTLARVGGAPAAASGRQRNPPPPDRRGVERYRPVLIATAPAPARTPASVAEERKNDGRTPPLRSNTGWKHHAGVAGPAIVRLPNGNGIPRPDLSGPFLNQGEVDKAWRDYKAALGRQH